MRDQWGKEAKNEKKARTGPIRKSSSNLRHINTEKECERERKREKERERERESVCVFYCGRERLCVCVCVMDKKRKDDRPKKSKCRSSTVLNSHKKDTKKTSPPETRARSQGKSGCLDK